MGTNLPIPAGAYKELTFDLYSLILPGYFWVNNEFTSSYRFMPAFESTARVKKGKVMHILSSDPKAVSFSDEYTMEYLHEGEQLYISFLNDRFLVNHIMVHYSTITAMILEMTGSDGKVQRLYAARSKPFDPMHKEVYGI